MNAYKKNGSQLSSSTLFWIAIAVATTSLLSFQNCASSESGPGLAKNSALELNTTRAKSVRLDLPKTSFESGEIFEFTAYAEDENGSTVSDFNYSSQFELTASGTNGLVELCAPNFTFQNGVLHGQASIINNNIGPSATLKLILKSVNLLQPVQISLSVSGQTENPFSTVNTSGTQPPARRHSSAIFDSQKKRILLFGGREVLEHVGNVQDGNALNDMWSLDLNQSPPIWQQLNIANSPEARFGHSMVFDSNRNRILLFGGENTSSAMDNSVWSYDLQNDAWIKLRPQNSGPGSRSKHSASFDKNLSYMTITGGGYGSISNTTDIFTLRTGTDENGNWTANGSFSSSPTASISSIYSNGSSKFFNPFFPETSVSDSGFNCYPENTGSGCIDFGRLSAFDFNSGVLWSLVGITEAAPPVVPNQSTQQYKPVLKVYKKMVPRKYKCPSNPL